MRGALEKVRTCAILSRPLRHAPSIPSRRGYADKSLQLVDCHDAQSILSIQESADIALQSVDCQGVPKAKWGFLIGIARHTF